MRRKMENKVWVNLAEHAQIECEHRSLRFKMATAKSAIFLWWHGIFWKTLFLTRMARPYSVAMCRRGLYRKFPDGRCMWCGIIHGRKQ